jgi:carboxyl-terminal processing protease
MKTSAKKHFRGGVLGSSSAQTKMIEKMIYFLAHSVNTNPTSFSWPPVSKTSCLVVIREGSSIFSLNIHPVLVFLRDCFDRGLIRPGDERRIEEALANGFLASLDRYSSYWNKTDAEIRMGERDGYTKDIGVNFCIYEGKVVVRNTLPNSPAEKAGLLFRDRIVGIDGVDTSNNDAQDLRRRLWGDTGTFVSLKISRPGFDRFLHFPITRRKMEIQSVFCSLFERNEKRFGILRITNFNENTDKQYDKYIGSIVRSRPDFVIIDLRDNRGGYIHIVRKIVGRLLGNGRVVLIEEYPSGKKVTRYSRGPFKEGLRGSLQNQGLKMICLTSRNTASGGEAMASALRDADIKLVGEQTYGKGIALVPTENSSGDGYYYTAEFKWLTSRGVCIEGIGLLPDINIRDSRIPTDMPLERAIEELLHKQ